MFESTGNEMGVHELFATIVEPFTPEGAQKLRYITHPHGPVQYRIASTPHGLHDLKELIFKRYPAAGYGTTVLSETKVSDDWVEAVIERASSCD